MFNCDSSVERGDLYLIECLRDLRLEGPSGRVGRSTTGGGTFFLCSLMVGLASSAFLRVLSCSEVEFEDFIVWTVWIARGRGSRFCDTYGRLFASSWDVNKRICDPSEGCPVGVELFSSPYEGGSE